MPAAQLAQSAVKQHEGGASRCKQADQSNSASEGLAERQHSIGTSSRSGEAQEKAVEVSYPSSMGSTVRDEPSAGNLQQAAVGPGIDAACPLTSKEQEEPVTAELQAHAAPDGTRRALTQGVCSLQDEQPSSGDTANGLQKDSKHRIGCGGPHC